MPDIVWGLSGGTSTSLPRLFDLLHGSDVQINGRRVTIGDMKTIHLMLLAASILATYQEAPADAPDLQPIRKLLHDGKPIEAIQAVDRLQPQIDPRFRLSRWSIDFRGRAVPVVRIGAKIVVVTYEIPRGGQWPELAGTTVGPTLHDDTDLYDNDTLIAAFDAVDGKRRWTRRAQGGVFVAVDDRNDAVYVWRQRLFELKPTTGETVKSVNLPGHPDRVRALIFGNHSFDANPESGVSGDDRGQAIQSFDVDSGKVVKRDLVLPTRLSPNEKRVLSFVSGSKVSVGAVGADQPIWTYERKGHTYNQPFWMGEDVVAMLGEQGGAAEVVRLSGVDGKPKWRFRLPRSGYSPSRDQLRNGSYPQRNWSAVGKVGDHILAIGGEGTLYFLNPDNGSTVARYTPATKYLAMPRLVDGALIVAGFDGVRSIPVDTVFRRAADDEGTLMILRAKALAAQDKLPEAVSVLDRLNRLDPDRADAWADLADLHHRRKALPESTEAYCRWMQVAGVEQSAVAYVRYGLVRRLALGNDLMLPAVRFGDQVVVASPTGTVYRIDPRTLEFDRREYGEPILRYESIEKLSGVAYGGSSADLGEVRTSGNPVSIDAPAAWHAVSGYDGPIVKWQGKHYRPLAGGYVRVLQDGKVTEHKTPLSPIQRWRIHLSTGAPLGYGAGGVFELDENLCPKRRLIEIPGDTPVDTLASDHRTLAIVAYQRHHHLLQIYSRDGKKLAEEMLVGPAKITRTTDVVTTVAGGYLCSGRGLMWVPATKGAAWKFQMSDDPGPALPKIEYTGTPLFNAPLAWDSHLFVSSRDGGLYVFDMARVTGR